MGVSTVACGGSLQQRQRRREAKAKPKAKAKGKQPAFPLRRSSRNKPMPSGTVAQGKVKALLQQKEYDQDEAANLIAAVAKHNLHNDSRPVANSGLREGLRSRSKKTDEQMAHELHSNLNKHKSVNAVAKALKKKKKKK